MSQFWRASSSQVQQPMDAATLALIVVAIRRSPPCPMFTDGMSKRNVHQWVVRVKDILAANFRGSGADTASTNCLLRAILGDADQRGILGLAR